MITQINSMPVAVPSAGPKVEASSNSNVQTPFGAVLSQLSKSTTSTQTSQASQVDLGAIQQMLQTTSLEDLFSTLGLQMPTTEINNLEDIAEALQMDEDKLKELFQELLGQAEIPSNLLDLVQLIEPQLPQVMEKITAMLQGQNIVSNEKGQQLIQALKVMDIVIPKKDLTWKQELSAFQLKDALQAFQKTLLNDEIKSTTLKTSKETVVNKLHVNEENTTVKVMQYVTKVEQKVEQVNVAVQGMTTQKIETATITLPSVKGMQPEAFAKEFEALINRSQFGQTPGLTKMLIKLYPEHLGTIRIELIQRDGVMTAKLLANTALGKEMLDSTLHQLKHAFQQQSIQVDRFDVTQALQDSNRQERAFNGSFGQKSEQQEEQQDEQNNEQDQTSFQDVLMEMEV